MDRLHGGGNGPSRELSTAKYLDLAPLGPETGEPFHYGTLTSTGRSMPVSDSTRSVSAGGADHRARCTTRRSSGRVPGRFRWPRRRYALLRPDRERRGSWRGSLRQPVARCEVESLLRSSCRGGCELRRNGFPQVGDGTVLLLSTILLRMHLAAARCRVGVAGTGRAMPARAGRTRLSGAASPAHPAGTPPQGSWERPCGGRRRSVCRHGPSPAGCLRDAPVVCNALRNSAGQRGGRHVAASQRHDGRRRVARHPAAASRWARSRAVHAAIRDWSRGAARREAAARMDALRARLSAVGTDEVVRWIRGFRSLADVKVTDGRRGSQERQASWTRRTRSVRIEEGRRWERFEPA